MLWRHGGWMTPEHRFKSAPSPGCVEPCFSSEIKASLPAPGMWDSHGSEVSTQLIPCNFPSKALAATILGGWRLQSLFPTETPSWQVRPYLSSPAFDLHSPKRHVCVETSVARSLSKPTPTSIGNLSPDSRSQTRRANV